MSARPRWLVALALCAASSACDGKVPATVEAAPDDPTTIAGPATTPHAAGTAHPGQNGPLTGDERLLARTAWRYFANNTQPATGLVNSVDGYASTTMWDAASAIAAIVSADRLGLIEAAAAQGRLARMLTTLASVPLFDDYCPNKAYQTTTAAMVDYNNAPGAIGCSAIDTGRLLLWLRVTAQRYPALAIAVGGVAIHLNPGAMVRDGGLSEVTRRDGKLAFNQEGRLGYEQYAAAGFALWGYDTTAAQRVTPHGIVSLYGVELPYDARDAAVFGAHSFLVSEPYILDGIETGWNGPAALPDDPFVHTQGWSARTAERVFVVQQRRFERSGILTARSEHQLRGAPFFVYDTIFSDGQPWATLSTTGELHPESAAMSTKAAIGLWALFDRPYAAQLFAAASRAVDPERGVYEGVIEGGGPIRQFTANNNGIILEALAYKVAGRLLQPGPVPAPGVVRPPGQPQAATIAAAAAEVDARPLLAALADDGPAVSVAPREHRRGPLTASDLAIARGAWRYFVNNTQPATGLVNAADGYASTTMWDTASALAAIYVAGELGLIPADETQRRIRRAVEAIGHLKLFRGTCANKAYNTATLALVNYANQPGEIGCSAIDNGRLLLWLRLLQHSFPDLSRPLADAVNHLNAKVFVRDGALYGPEPAGRAVLWRQEGRLGYEEYAARGFGALGFDIASAARAAPYAITRVDGVPILHDYRDRQNSGGSNYVVTEGVTLEEIELGWDSGWKQLAADMVYAAQEQRFTRTGILTARSEHQLAAAPNFVYDTVFADRRPWATLSATGGAHSAAAAVSFKAAMAMWAIWPSTYTDRLYRAVAAAAQDARGLREGTLESGASIWVHTANNNGIILEALLYRVNGPLGRRP